MFSISKQSGNEDAYLTEYTADKLADVANLLYIGESSDILNRWIAHKINTLYDYGQKDYKEEKYAILREAWNRNYPISCRVLEYCENDKQVLRTREKEWIKQCQPILNGGRATIGFKGWEFLMNLPTCEKNLDN